MQLGLVQNHRIINSYQPNAQSRIINKYKNNKAQGMWLDAPGLALIITMLASS
jgi:hypothetical protein